MVSNLVLELELIGWSEVGEICPSSPNCGIVLVHSGNLQSYMASIIEVFRNPLVPGTALK